MVGARTGRTAVRPYLISKDQGQVELQAGPGDGDLIYAHVDSGHAIPVTIHDTIVALKVVGREIRCVAIADIDAGGAKAQGVIAIGQVLQPWFIFEIAQASWRQGGGAGVIDL